MVEKDDPPENPKDDARLTDLNNRLDQAQKLEQARTTSGGQSVDANYKLGNRVLADLIAGIGGGALIGWFIDRLADTSPWGLLGLMSLGTAVAFRNIIRLGSKPPSEHGKE